MYIYYTITGISKETGKYVSLTNENSPAPLKLIYPTDAYNVLKGDTSNVKKFLDEVNPDTITVYRQYNDSHAVGIIGMTEGYSYTEAYEGASNMIQFPFKKECNIEFKSIKDLNAYITSVSSITPVFNNGNMWVDHPIPDEDFTCVNGYYVYTPFVKMVFGDLYPEVEDRPILLFNDRILTKYMESYIFVENGNFYLIKNNFNKDTREILPIEKDDIIKTVNEFFDDDQESDVTFLPIGYCDGDDAEYPEYVPDPLIDYPFKVISEWIESDTACTPLKEILKEKIDGMTYTPSDTTKYFIRHKHDRGWVLLKNRENNRKHSKYNQNNR